MKTLNNSFDTVVFVPAYIYFGDKFSNPLFTSVATEKVEIADGLYQDVRLQSEDEKDILDTTEKFFFVKNGLIFRCLGSSTNYKPSYSERAIKAAITRLNKYA
jgi:hypothetical protein